MRDVTYVESEKNGLEMTGLGNAMDNNVENEKNELDMAGVRNAMDSSEWVTYLVIN